MDGNFDLKNERFCEFEDLLNEGYGQNKINFSTKVYSDQSVFATFFGLVAVFSAVKAAPEVQISIHLLHEQTDRIFRLNFSIFLLNFG